jgi:GT2 family glycosyltransferase
MSCGASLAVLMTCFNRSETTLKCLDALHVAVAQTQLRADIFLVDDASTDGTAARVREAYPTVQVLRGGDLYWARGMHLAFKTALSQGYDYYLWLNDDTLINAQALSQMVASENRVRGKSAASIIVGSTADAHGQLSYGGETQVKRWCPIYKLHRVIPGTDVQPIDTMNGNIVLINAAAAQLVGNIDPAFEHAMGDIDYGFRAKGLGVGLWLAPGIQGLCSGNSIQGTYQDKSLALTQRLRLIMNRKSLPWRSWLLLTYRHGSWIWPALFVWPYARLLFSGCAAAVRSTAAAPSR